MSTITIHTSSIDAPRCEVRRISLSAPFTWLARGGRDMLRHWPTSLGLGVLFAGIGYALTQHAWAHAHLAMFFSSGFLLVAPFLALGFYAISKRAEAADSGSMLPTLRGNLDSIGMYALSLAFILSVWERLSAIMVALFYRGNLPGGEQISLNALLAVENLSFMLPWAITGGMLAALVFALSVVTLPLLMDRTLDFITAMGTSLRVVLANPGPMLVWAASIAALVLLGEALWFVGLAITLPLLGHATWHAYRDLVREA